MIPTLSEYVSVVTTVVIDFLHGVIITVRLISVSVHNSVNHCLEECQVIQNDRNTMKNLWRVTVGVTDLVSKY